MGESEEVTPVPGDKPDHASADKASMMGDWSTAGGFFSSILSGLLVGLAGDYLLGTDPWLVIVGVVAGFAIGFWRMVAYSDKIIEQADNPRLRRIAKLRREMEADEDDDT